MPTYDYRCSKCSCEFELFLSLAERASESEKKMCPKCSSNQIEVMMTFNGGILSSSQKTCGPSGCGSQGGCLGGGCPFSS